MAVETIQNESHREKSEKISCVFYSRGLIHVIGVIKAGEGITKRLCGEITAEHFLNLMKTIPRNSVNPKCKACTEAHHNQLLQVSDKEKMLKAKQKKDKLYTEEQKYG